MTYSDLIERLRTEAELIHNNGITRKLSRHRVSALLREAAIALEAAQVDAERYRRLRVGDIDDIAVVRGLGAMDYGMSGVAYTYSEEIDGDDLDAALEDAREDAERWRQAFVDERASRYRADGMKIEQARIHAETDAGAAALEAALEDAEKWRKCNTTHDIGDGERIECRVIVGVNVYDEKGWIGFEQTTQDEFFKMLDAIDQLRGKEVQDEA